MMRTASLSQASGCANLLHSRSAPPAVFKVPSLMSGAMEKGNPLFEFHVAREARDLYQFDQSIFAFSGNAVIADFYAARVFADKMNARRDLLHYPERAVEASQINAMGIIDEVLHMIMAQYRQQVNPAVMEKALSFLNESIGVEAVETTLRRFGDRFPPSAVYRRELDLDVYLEGQTSGLSHREVQTEELLMLWLSNTNPAFAPYIELFDDNEIEQRSAYKQIVAGLAEFFAGQEGFGPGEENLLDMLQAPMRASPHSLAGQLEFVRTRWTRLIGAQLYRLLSSLDFIAEEHKAVFSGPGPVEALSFAGQEAEYEQYSRDLDWMPRLVLLARNAYVWLDQLSKSYGRPIATLADIPDVELDTLADRGITGLWLIGLWERSKASQRIKQMMGNPEAVASAYSLHDYAIAADLGGPEALADLKQRAWQRGIRMASDMVPNHMAIDSRWVVQHPDWFLQLNYCPYPSYSFSGPDLSSDERVAILLEDHYFDRTDAAVVFKRVDRWTGEERFIYHGNDGTTMPWNDTAQLDYLKPDVREAVIQTILHVARQFPVIRFDAAMTLAKRHIQRLWFPEPGTGGAIASRAEHGLSKADFDAAIPIEFWREVVDRVAAEAPDTLLLAEAFWLMEGYFVRTLGMHRVYNSAFMHMLRDEDNDKYRQLIKNTVEFDPEILKRYVNFMSNPDEQTAVAQFGKDDKYFGVATVMATVPGLPMFGHGQFEGFHEKYGMEYRRAYYDETPDRWLIDRHLHEITPLLKRRYLFAEVSNFLLYDFYTASGSVDENVLAYSNRTGDEHSLVVYHNKFADTRGWIRTSAAFLDKGSGQLMQRTLAESLELSADPDAYVIFRDLITNLEYLRSCRDLVENGLYISLGGYQRHVFLDFRRVQDNEWRQYSQLTAYLAGRGVPDVAEAVKELFLQPLHYPYRELINAGALRTLFDARLLPTPSAANGTRTADLDAISAQILALLHETRRFAAERAAVDVAARQVEPAPGLDVGILARRVLTAEKEAALSRSPQSETEEAAVGEEAATAAPDLEALAARLRQELESALALPVLAARLGLRDETAAFLQEALTETPAAWGGLFAWVFTHALGRAVDDDNYAARARSWLDEWLLGKLVAQGLQDLGQKDPQRSVTLLKALVTHQDWLQTMSASDLPAASQLSALLETLLRDRDVQSFLQVNRYGGVLWYNKESFGDLLHGLMAVAAILSAAQPDDDAAEGIELAFEILARLQAADAEAGYRVEKLIDLVK